MLRSQMKKNDGFGWGPVSNYKPGGGGVNYLNQHKNNVQNKYGDQWNTNQQNMPPGDYQGQPVAGQIVDRGPLSSFAGGMGQQQSSVGAALSQHHNMGSTSSIRDYDQQNVMRYPQAAPPPSQYPHGSKLANY